MLAIKIRNAVDKKDFVVLIDSATESEYAVSVEDFKKSIAPKKRGPKPKEVKK